MKSCGFVLPVAFALGCSAAWAQNVKVAPLGSHTGELCERDRATIFEDPTGVRIRHSAILMMLPMAACIGRKVENIRGKPTTACAFTGSDLVVPLPAACLAGVQLGGSRTVKTTGAAKAVEITAVVAAHDSTVSRDLLTDPEKKNLDPDNVSITLGPSAARRGRTRAPPRS